MKRDPITRAHVAADIGTEGTTIRNALDAILDALPSGATADVTLSEIGDGTYGVSFTPTTQERWLVTVDYDDGTTARNFRQTYAVAGIRTRLGRGEYWVHAELLR